MDPGESLTAAARREAAEEAGVAIRVVGLLCCEAHRQGAWRRVIFYAEPDEGEGEGVGEEGGGHEGCGEEGAEERRQQQQDEDEEDVLEDGMQKGVRDSSSREGGQQAGSGGGGDAPGPGAARPHVDASPEGGRQAPARRGAAPTSLPARRDSPKSVPDFESAGACWASLEQLERAPLRSAAEARWFWEVARGCEVAPLAMPLGWAEVFSDVPL